MVADPSAFQLSYGSVEDFNAGLVQVVGPPTAKADGIYQAMLQEHERAKDFQVWTNSKAIPVELQGYVHTIPLDEFRYVGREQRAHLGGHSGYQQALKTVKTVVRERGGSAVIDAGNDECRDAGHEGWLPEHFMLHYAINVHAINQKIHDQNLATVAGTEFAQFASILAEAWAPSVIEIDVKDCAAQCNDLFQKFKCEIRKYNGKIKEDINPKLRDEEKGMQLMLLTTAELTVEEVIALRLYSGPCYTLYNKTCRDGVRNVFSTTLNVINSGQIKISRTTTACKVYRGVKGKLPKQFFETNVFGVRGGIEKGFMSTSEDRDVAVSYMGASGTRVLFEIQMGMIDKGADISFLSQYPAEKEILFAPLTGLEVLKMKVDRNGIFILETRLNTNLKAETIEEIQGRMKRVHLQLVDIVDLDCRALGFTKQEAMVPLEEHKKMAAELNMLEFNKSEKYLELTKAALTCKLEACAVVMKECASGLEANPGDKQMVENAVSVLLNPADSEALSVGIPLVLGDPAILASHNQALVTACKDATIDKLDLGGKGLTCELPPCVLALLGSLKYYDLSGNSFKNSFSRMDEILVYDHKNLNGIIELNLESKELGTCSELLCRATSLRVLNLSYNNLKELPESFGNLTALQELVLFKNQLKELPESFGNLKSLQTASFARNQLESLPESFGELTALTELHLWQNQLEELPDSFCNLTSLQLANFERNKLEKLPESFGNLTSLKELGLGKNKITHLPESFGNLTNLQEANFRQNQITHLPESFVKLTALTTVKLQGNRIKSGEIQRLQKQLQNCDISS